MHVSESVWQAVYRRPRLVCALWVISHAGVVVSVVGFAGMLGWLLFVKWPAVIVAIGCLGGGFVFVSLWRRWQNAERPYQRYEVLAGVRKTKAGQSFPSRHAFSAFAIGTWGCLLHPALCAVLLMVAVLQSAARFLLGVHYLRDVLVGAVVGAAVGGACAWLCLLVR